MLTNPPLQNWARNITYAARSVHSPKSVEELATLVANSNQIRALGSKHSFNRIADTTGDLVLLDRLPRIFELNSDRTTVTLDGGMTYGQLCPLLEAEGLALANLASLPHISVAGACASGTHGSGQRNGSLSTAVVGLELVTDKGSTLRVDRQTHATEFDGMVVALGALGVVTKISLAVVPSFQVSQNVYEFLPIQAALDHFDDIQACGYSVSLFTDWQSDDINQVWIKRISDGSIPAANLFGATLSHHPLHPIASVSAEHCTEQLNTPGPWCERLAHFKLEFTPSKGEELQSEYFVPRSHFAQAFQAVSSLRYEIAPLLLISEIRTIAADHLWLSPAFQRDCVAFHFTWQHRASDVLKFLPDLEAALDSFSARPHWAKLFTIDGRKINTLYPKSNEFRELASRLDPTGKFRNEFVNQKLFSAS